MTSDSSLYFDTYIKDLTKTAIFHLKKISRLPCLMQVSSSPVYSNCKINNMVPVHFTGDSLSLSLDLSFLVLQNMYIINVFICILDVLDGLFSFGPLLSFPVLPGFIKCPWRLERHRQIKCINGYLHAKRLQLKSFL